jgi:hypothetical protein
MKRAVPRTGSVVALAVAAAVSLAAGTPACGSGGDTAPGTFKVDFPTTAAAIAVAKLTPGVQVFVYPTSVEGSGSGAMTGACQTLVEQSRTGNLTATAIASSTILSPCDLLNGKGSLPVGYGSYAFLAVAQSSPGQDFLVGCAEQTLSSANTVVTIPMTLASSSMAVPATTCTTVAQTCTSGNSC